MPPITVNPGDISAAVRAVGRARVFHCTLWSLAANIARTHLGDTEGDQSVAVNEELVHLTVPELTGPAKHASYVQGADPLVTIPLFLADPALRATLTPLGGTGGAGHSSRREVTYHTLVLIPEELFRNADGELAGILTLDAGTWKLDGVALTAEQQRLLDLSVWLWKGYFVRPPIEFKHGEGGKLVSQGQFQVCYNAAMPEGEQLFTRGDPADVGIDLNPVPA